MPADSHHVPLPRTLVLGLSAVAVALLAGSLAGQASRFFLGHDHVYGLVPLLNIDGEGNLAAFFSAALLCAAAGVLLTTARADRVGGRRIYWALLGVGFLLMAADEWFSVHERLTPLLRRRSLPGIFFFAWLMVAVPLLALLPLVFGRFWWRLPRQTRTRVAVSAGLYLSGAFGMEMVSGAYAARAGEDNFTYALLVTLEESLEMFGVVALIGTVTAYRRALPDSPVSAASPAPAGV